MLDIYQAETSAEEILSHFEDPEELHAVLLRNNSSFKRKGGEASVDQSGPRKWLKRLFSSGVTAKSKFEYIALALHCCMLDEELMSMIELPDFVGQFRPLCVGTIFFHIL